jgi:hypothetical protein
MKTTMKQTDPIIELSCAHTISGDHQSKVYKLNGKVLDPALSITFRQHSSEFNHGYNGSGPAQLALAVCLELFGPVGQCFYQDFKEKHIGPLGHQRADMHELKAEEPQFRDFNVMVDVTPFFDLAARKQLVLEFQPGQSLEERESLINVTQERPSRFATSIWLETFKGWKEWKFELNGEFRLATKAILIFWYD